MSKCCVYTFTKVNMKVWPCLSRLKLIWLAPLTSRGFHKCSLELNTGSKSHSRHSFLEHRESAVVFLSSFPLLVQKQRRWQSAKCCENCRSTRKSRLPVKTTNNGGWSTWYFESEQPRRMLFKTYWKINNIHFRSEHVFIHSQNTNNATFDKSRSTNHYLLKR